MSRWEQAALLWRGVDHDRNGHYLSGLDLALAIRSFDLAGVVDLLERARVWPPVHDFALAFTLLLGGFDHRLGGLPSLLGWGATAMLVWVIASRAFPDPMRSVTAGLVATGFTLASPAFRLLGTDVMLECLGAGLTALSLFLYLRCQAEPSDAARWRLLGLALTVLFFEKGNYWGLTIAGLSLAWLVENWRSEHVRRLRGKGAVLRRHAAGLLRDPLALAALATTAVIVVIAWHGPWVIEPFGQRVSLYPPQNLTTLAYAFLFIRAAVLWRRHRAALEARLGAAGRAIFYWHVVPLALSLLVPKRLYALIWFIGHPLPPSRYGVPDDVLSVVWAGFAEGFHPGAWAATLALLLAAIAVARLRNLGPAMRAVAILGAVCTVAVAVHPNHQWRFLASWIFTLWILAGVGAGVLVGLVARAVPMRWRYLAAGAPTGALIVALALATFAGPPSAMARAAAAQYRNDASDLDLAAAYLPFVDGSEPVAFLSSLARAAFFVWTVHEQCRCRVRVELPWIDQARSRDGSRRMVEAWLTGAPVRRIVVVEPFARSFDAELAKERMAGIFDAMQAQTRFVRGETVVVPSFPAEVTFWNADASAAGP
jgi:hypothetical protein